ncbi:MAG: DinB family protein [Actinomycetota bacterium]|nr:DinB family protein [Actinomycetota bacterium]
MPDELPEYESPATLPERKFGWSNVFLPPEQDPRDYGPVSGERETLLSYLHAYRQTLELKCAGLDASAMAARSVPPSNLSLLGLIRHMAEVEHHWFRRVMAGEDAPRIYRTEKDRDAAFTGAVADQAVVDEAWATWNAQVAFAEEFVENHDDLGVIGVFEHGGTTEELALREVLLHMIEEYARHCGHADLLRERIDGRVGQ